MAVTSALFLLFSGSYISTLPTVPWQLRQLSTCRSSTVISLFCLFSLISEFYMFQLNCIILLFLIQVCIVTEWIWACVDFMWSLGSAVQTDIGPNFWCNWERQFSQLHAFLEDWNPSFPQEIINSVTFTILTDQNGVIIKVLCIVGRLVTGGRDVFVLCPSAPTPPCTAHRPLLVMSFLVRSLLCICIYGCDNNVERNVCCCYCSCCCSYYYLKKKKFTENICLAPGLQKYSNKLKLQKHLHNNTPHRHFPWESQDGDMSRHSNCRPM